MSLSITITEPRATYRPGDQVAGTLTFGSVNKSTPAQQVLISLKHISKCRFGIPDLDTLYNAEICLNEQTIELLEEAPTTLQSTQEWPFKFIVPESTGYLASPFHEPSRLYNDDPDQVLPPTYTLPKKESSGAQERVSITLGLYAEVLSGKVTSNVFKKDAIATSMELDFLPPRKTYPVDWKMTTKQARQIVRTPLLAEVNGHRQRSLSIKEKMLTTMKSSTLPSVTFDVLLSLPKVAVVGQPVPCFVGLLHERASNQAQECPTVVLKSLVIKLDKLTALRGLSESKSLFRTEYLPASHSSWVKTIELGKLANPIELSDIIDLREHIQARIPDDTMQSFNTFNIARTYTFQVAVSVECAKQKFSFGFELGPVQMLAAHERDKEQPPGLDPSLAMEAEALPTWEESGGYGTHGIPVEKEDLPPLYT